MKKFTKICLILCLALIFAAAICAGAGVAMGSGLSEIREMIEAGEFNIAGHNIVGKNILLYNETMDEQELESVPIKKGYINETFEADEINELLVDMKYGKIRFVESEDEQIHIQLDAPQSNSYECYSESGILSLTDASGSFKKWNHNHDTIVKRVTLEIAIPADKKFENIEFITDAGIVESEINLCGASVDLEIEAGQLTAEKIEAAELELDVGAGQLIVDSFAAGELEANCGAGEMRISGSVEGDLTASCGVGMLSFDLEGEEDDYNYIISGGVGEVRINGSSYSGLGMQKEIDNDAENDILLDCGVGEISIRIE